jgi:hypothetical protein
MGNKPRQAIGRSSEGLMMWIYLTLFMSCCWIAWDDLINREIHVLAPITLVFTGFGISYFSDSMNLHSLLLNTAILTAIFTLLFTYGYLRFGRAFLKEKFGLGDVFVMYALVPYFPSYTLILVIVLGCVVGILGMATLPSFKSKGAPLAGIYGILLPLSLICEKLVT